MVHEIQVSQYKTVPSSIKLGTFDSYGTEQLHFTFGSGWENLAVYATFTAPNGKSTQTAVDLEGYTDVPAEATAGEAGQGEIVLVGKAEGVNRITVTLHYTVLEHGPVQGAEPAVPTPDLLQQVLTLSKDAQQSAKNAEQSAKNAVKDATDTVKPYKEEAVQAAAAAALSEKSAAESKVAAAKSAQAALESKNAAATSEENAAASAKKAQGIADSLPADYTTAVNEIAALKTNKADQAELDTVKQQVKSITPDDSTVGEKPWSSKNIVDMLCPPLEESGNPVVCYPVAGYPLDVKAKWEPVQEGSGTPSPENIRPIKGRDSVKVERCGENLLNINQLEPNGYNLAGSNTLKPNTTYTFKPVSCGGIAFALFLADNINPNQATKQLDLTGKYINEGESATFTTPSNINSYSVMWLAGGKAGIHLVYPNVQFMLVTGTTAPTTYKPYIGQTNALTLPETVYGGEVDAVSGEGTKNWRKIVYDGTEKWNARDTNYTSYSLALPMRAQTGFCTHFKKILYDAIRPDTGTGETGCYLEFSSSAIFNVTFENVTDWKNYLAAQYAAGTPVCIVFQYSNKANEPFTATGAQPLLALSGTNTVLTDADSATVTGRADPVKRIEDLEDAVASQT